MTVLAKLVPFFSNVLALFFLTHSLIDRCQIVTDNCKIMFQSLFGSILNHLYRYTDENVSVRHLFNLHHLYFNSVPFTRSKIVQFMEDLDVSTALNHSGSYVVVVNMLFTG